MFYEEMKELPDSEFKRYCGVTREVFGKMTSSVAQVIDHRRGRPCHLSNEDQIILTLDYLRNSKTMFLLSKEYKIAESSVCRTIKRIENILNKCEDFHLPSKQELTSIKIEIREVVTDMTAWQTEVLHPEGSNCD